jgi:glyoxylase-like metal-dependent hydrolase (beta-lactamase superfamily II)
VASAGEVTGGWEVAPGLWRWIAFHPEWKQDVASYAHPSDDGLVLIDPLVPTEPPERRRFWRWLDGHARGEKRPVHVLLTVFWHKRSAPEVLKRYATDPGAVLWAPAGAESKLTSRVDHPFGGAERPPAGIVAFETPGGVEVVLWLPQVGAVVSGDILLGGKRKPLRVCPQSWLPRDVTRAEVAASLARLRSLPVERVLPTHGEPVLEDARAVLAEALDDAAA